MFHFNSRLGVLCANACVRACVRACMCSELAPPACDRNVPGALGGREDLPGSQQASSG
jgi:hypothetical protein